MTYKHYPFAIVAILFLSFAGNSHAQWKVGNAKTVITPTESMWLGGYAARDRPSEGKLHDLWAKAIVLDDGAGNRAVLITAELIRLYKPLTDDIKRQLHDLYGLSEAQVILNVSHTHSGPEIYPEKVRFQAGPEEMKKIAAYARKFTGQIVSLVGQALGNMKPATIHAGNGVARFAVNRRTNSEAEINQGRVKYLQGPSDHAVPVLKATGPDGKLLAVVFGYACHPTVLAGYEWSGDYAGFAQYELESSFPGTNFLFFQGAGGDQNPLPRRSVPLARQYGRTLAASVRQVLEDNAMKPLSPGLSFAYSEIELKPAKGTPSKEELVKIISAESGHSDWIKNFANSLLEQLEKEGALPGSYRYPVQVWNVGGHPVVALGGEIVVDYAIRLKRIFEQHIFVMGYSNDVIGYIPSERVLEEGGYEGERSYVFTSPWRSDIESRIIEEVIRLSERTGITYKK